MEKGYISLECKREEHAEERIEEESQIDVGATKIVRELRAKSSTAWKMRERPGGKASDETNELDGRRRRLDQREKDEKL